MDNLPFDVIGMNWWMLESPLETRAGRQQLIELMERWLPNCLPESYGVSEPPAHNYDHCGREHFLQFLDENLGFLSGIHVDRLSVSRYNFHRLQDPK